MVGRDGVQNAVSLNSVLTNASRAVGPAVAGLLIATAGVGVRFLASPGTGLPPGQSRPGNPGRAAADRPDYQRGGAAS